MLYLGVYVTDDIIFALLLQRMEQSEIVTYITFLIIYIMNQFELKETNQVVLEFDLSSF